MADTIMAKVYRYNPSVDQAPTYVTYKVPRSHPQMSILQVLRYIHDEIDPIAFEYCCRAASCGTCGVIVDGTPVLACIKAAPDQCTIEPLKGLRVIKDLVVDRNEIDNRLFGTAPWFERTSPMTTPESMDPDVYLKVANLQLCKDCMLCMAACPQVESLGFQNYAGPYIMIKIASRYFDTREDFAEDRLKTAVREGLFNCIECGKCHEVCPRGAILETDGYPNATLDHVAIYQEMKADAEALGLKPSEENADTEVKDIDIFDYDASGSESVSAGASVASIDSAGFSSTSSK